MQYLAQEISSPSQIIPYQFTPPLTFPTEFITPSANRLIDLVSEHYPAAEPFLSLSASARQAARIMSICHTSALGGHVEQCPDGHIKRFFYNSCGHRFCPRCAARMRTKWLLDREPKLLPVRHYHTIFTLPHTFNTLWHFNSQLMGDLLFHSSVDALKALLADPRWLGAEVGITVAIETWDDRMRFHPHLHCIVTGGGLTPEGDWVDVENPRCLVAVKPLMWEFRKRFCRGIQQLLQDGDLTLPGDTKQRYWLARIRKINRQQWAVFIAKQPEDGGPTTDEIMRYLSKNVAGGPLSGDRVIPKLSKLSATQLAYLKSAPLSETRLEDAPGDEVRFYWGSYDPITQKRMRSNIETLPVAEFLERYLQHVPPSGYQTIRHYGLYTSAKKIAYEQCANLLADRKPMPSSDENKDEPIFDNESWIADHTCPVCGKPLVVTAHLPSSLSGHVVKRPTLGPVIIRFPTQGGFCAS